MKNVILLAHAAADLEHARQFYETQEPGLGEHCVTSVLADLESLTRLGAIRFRQQRYYRMIEKTFHPGIYYREEGIRRQLRQRLNKNPLPGVPAAATSP